jgi:hypothetical protein
MHERMAQEQISELPINNGSVILLHYLFKMLPVFVGAFAIWLGYKLFVLGVSGQASLDVQSKTIKAQLLNAAPGLFFAVGGIVIVIVSVWKGTRIKYADPFSHMDIMMEAREKAHK